MSKPKLKVVEADEQAANQTQDSREQTDDFTEALPPLHVDPTSFDVRIAGIENCSVARELAKHWASVTAFEIEREAARREGQGEPQLSDADEDKRFRE
jgi:spermidine synthase